MKYNISVSIVLYNTDVLEIQNVLKNVRESKLSIKTFFVDNSPSEELKASIPTNDNVEYIFTGKNLGFGAGHNVAITKAKNISEFHLVLNADVEFKGTILDEMYAFMKEHEEIGLLAPKIYNPDGTLQYSAKLLPTPANLIIRRFVPIKAIQDKMDYRYEMKFFDFDRMIEVPYVMGCFMLIKNQVFEKVQGFDERFFMYPEDIDLTRRIHAHYKTIYYPHVSIIHKHGKGSYKSRKLLYYHISSMIKYFNKWGWIFDSDRERINSKLLSQFQ
ncbi:MAG: glycosyltransferase family 2 protein [Maribacter sp.]|nr:glycosyltransferase family 2 protein [Maribacter sp.]